MPKKKDIKVKNKGGRPVEWTPKKLDKLSKELIACVSREDVFHVSYFECVEKNKEDGWLLNIAKRHPEFRGALKQAQRILGNKIMNHAMFKGGDKWVIKTLTPMYMDDIKQNQRAEQVQELEDKMKFEKYKHDISSALEDDITPKIEGFNKSVETQRENIRLKKLLSDSGISFDEEPDSE